MGVAVSIDCAVVAVLCCVWSVERGSTVLLDLGFVWDDGVGCAGLGASAPKYQSPKIMPWLSSAKYENRPGDISRAPGGHEGHCSEGSVSFNASLKERSNTPSLTKSVICAFVVFSL